MASDIHMHVERKINNVWEQVPEEQGIQNPYYELALNEEAKKFFDHKTWNPGRNFALFGLLAGVGSKVFYPFIPPRGLPEDVSVGVKSKYDECGKKVQTPSYLTLTELLSFQDTIEDVPCVLDIEQFKKFKKTGKVPHDYYHAGPKDVQLVSHEKMTRVMNLSSLFDHRLFFTKVEHKVPVKELSKSFWVDIVEAMKVLSSDANEVRCVFWFDC